MLDLIHIYQLFASCKATYRIVQQSGSAAAAAEHWRSIRESMADARIATANDNYKRPAQSWQK